MKLIKFQIGILSILLSFDLSIQQALFGVNLNLDPVLSALTPNKKPVESTTSASVVTNRFQPKPPSGPSCGRRKIHHTGLITGGQPTKPGDWPWHVAIYRMKSSSSEQKYVCGGSLLTTSRVLTGMDNTRYEFESNDLMVFNLYSGVFSWTLCCRKWGCYSS